MEDMKVLETLKEKVLEELRPVATKNSLTPNEISVAKEAVCLLKEIEEVLEKGEEKMETSEGRGRSRSSYGRGSSRGYYDPYMYEPYAYGPYMGYGEPGRMYAYGDEYMMSRNSMARGRDPMTGQYISRGMDGQDTSGRRYTFSYDTDSYDGRSRGGSGRSYEGGRGNSGRSYEDSYEGGSMNSGRSYERSRDSGRSGHSIDDRIVDMLERMMDTATSNYERNKLNTIIRVVDSMRGE